MAIHEDGVQMEAGLQIYYKCTARDDWFPLPPGYIIDIEGEHNPFAQNNSRVVDNITIATATEHSFLVVSYHHASPQCFK